MARATSGVLESNNGIVARTPGLNDAILTLNDLIAEIGGHSTEQMKKGAELTKLKKEARTAFVTGILKIRAAVSAYATASTDPEVKKLKEKYQGPDSEVKRMRDMPLFSYGYLVYGDAASFATQLDPFATEAEVVELKDLADNFNASLPQKRTQLTKSSVSTQNLEEALTRIDSLLNDTIDVLVKPWEYKEPDFFKVYTNARIIVNTASRKKQSSPEATVTPA